MRTITSIVILSASIGLLSGCSNQQVDTAVGGAAGAGLGYAVTGGSAVGTIIGGGAGALIGNQIGQNEDQRYYYRY